MVNVLSATKIKYAAAAAYLLLLAVAASSDEPSDVVVVDNPPPLPPASLYEFTQSELQEMLPPQPEWSGQRSSEEFGFTMDDHSSSEWSTPAESSNYTETATYEEVTEFIKRLEREAPDNMIDVRSLTKLPNGEDLWLVTVSSSSSSEEGNNNKSPESLRSSGKPTVFIHSAIHPGESSGVNAGLMLVRDMVVSTTTTTEKEDKEPPSMKWLLDKVNLIWIPILNIQGYKRQSPTGRTNQHGPNTSGRRATNGWHNINRDYSKLDTIEAKSVIRVFNDYEPDFFIDAHSTDGMNYQYDVTWCDNGDSGLSPSIYKWMRSELAEDLSTFLRKLDHVPGPCVDANDKMNPENGFYPYFTDGAAYSTNYADHRQIPAYLLEIHALKPNRQRVYGAYAFFVGVMDVVGTKASSLRKAIDADKAARINPVPIAWDYDPNPPNMTFLGNEYTKVINDVLGGVEQMIWTDKPKNYTIEMSIRSTPLNPPTRPVGYVIPAYWTDVIEIVQAHGIETKTFREDQPNVDVIRYRFNVFEIGNPNREGRATASGTPSPERHSNTTYHPGDVYVSTDQPLGTLAVALLEPTGESNRQRSGYCERLVEIPRAERPSRIQRLSNCSRLVLQTHDLLRPRGLSSRYRRRHGRRSRFH